MKLPDAGSMILDRKTSTCWKVEVSERNYVHDSGDMGEELIHLECVGYDGTFLTIEDEDLHDDETRYVELEPLQVLEMAKHLTEQACSYNGDTLVAKRIQRELCLKAIWLLQWFSAED